MTAPLVRGRHALAAICAALALLLGCKNFRSGYDKGFKESFSKEFTTSCTTEAVKKGAAEDAVRPVCKCMGDYLAEHQSSTELTKLSIAPSSPETTKIIEDATSACKTAR